MNFDEYQELAARTALYPEQYRISYPALGLAGEAGEVANKAKKLLRGDFPLTPEFKKDLASELGDVLWYCAALATDLGTTLNEVALANLDKLKVRSERGTIRGSGDNR